MVLIPFRAVFALVRFDGPFNLPKHQLAQSAHRSTQCIDLRQRPEIPDGSKFAGIHDGDIQSAPGHDQIGSGYPEKHSDATSLDEDIAHLKEKVDAGARYVVTQLFFDNAKFFDYRERCRKAGINVPIVPGIKPLAVARHLEILPQIFGTAIPEALEREVRLHIDNPKAVREIGSEWCIAQCRELKAAGVPVLHFYTMSRTEEIARIAKAVF